MADGRDITRALRTLKKRFPNPGAMEFGGRSLPAGRQAYRTLVAVMLSARTRDEQVLKLLPGFFKLFPTVGKLARASVADVNAKLLTIGMHRQKARNLIGMAQKVQKEQRGRVPDTMEELVDLPGVGRKTASVVLVACFGQRAIAVDTHVHRVTNRLGWVKTKTPEQTERALLGLVPPNLMHIVNRVFVKFGRYICIPGKPRCWDCPIREQCAYPKKNLTPPRDADAIRADIERRERELETLRRSV